MTNTADPSLRATLRKINQEIKENVGQRVTLDLAPQARKGPRRTGRVLGVLEAADGMVVTFAPEDEPDTEVTYHAHYILAVRRM
jgi:uncharacterized protein Veg